MSGSIQGVWTAIITPFKDDRSIDWKAFDQLIGEQVQAGIDGLVVCGTTGETPTLSNEEKLQLVRKAKEWCGGKMPIMAGTGGNDTNASIELSLAALEAGASSLLIVTPPYNKPSVEGLSAHFGAIATATKAPICLYHVPSRTGQRLTAEAIKTLCSIKGIEAVKEASGDIALFTQCVLACAQPILSGDDLTYLGSLAVGGKGCISVASNVYPKAIVKLHKAYAAGQIDVAAKINAALFPAFEALFCETNPAPAKAFLSIRKTCTNQLRLPLVPVQKKNLDLIKQVMVTTEQHLRQLGL